MWCSEFRVFTCFLVRPQHRWGVSRRPAGECLSEPGPSLRHRVLLDLSAAVPVMHHSGQSQSRMQSAFILKWGRGKCDVNETEKEAEHCVCTRAVRQNSDKSYQCKGLWEHWSGDWEHQTSNCQNDWLDLSMWTKARFLNMFVLP